MDVEGGDAVTRGWTVFGAVAFGLAALLARADALLWCVGNPDNVDADSYEYARMMVTSTGDTADGLQLAAFARNPATGEWTSNMDWGVIDVVNAASLPNLGLDFTGTVELTSNRYAFTLQKDATKAVEAIEIESSVRLPAQVTIDLDLTSASSGEILLMSFDAVASETSFSLGTVTNPRNKPVKLVVRNGQVYADVGKNGLLMIIK